jgi:hypothetical protein
VIERGQDFGLTLEAGEAVRVLRQMRRQGLDRDLTMQASIAREKKLAHAAAAEFTLDLEGADGGWAHATERVSDLARGTPWRR